LAVIVLRTEANAVQAGDMPIVADTKNWTWVIERPCPECGFDARDFVDADIAPAIRDNAESWRAVLVRPTVRMRPNDSTWSPLEYAAHVRDVLKVYRERLGLMVASDDPLFPNWDQDATAVEDAYNEQDPETVGAQLGENAGGLADDFASLRAEQWSRPGRRSDGASFTISSMSKYLVHDLVHHRWDVSEH
jgi:hypothetical protein